MNLAFFIENFLLGVGLAMDAFSVSLVNGISEPCMKKKKVITIALVFAIFQAVMPLIGWLCVHTIVDKFEAFRPFIPWIAFLLLLYIGGGMIKDGIKGEEVSDLCNHKIGFTALIVQGIATSIDALSVGFTLATYSVILALTAAIIIATVTFVICSGGVVIGKRFGTYLSNKSLILGGSILLVIGFEILIKGII